jgi:hypothetical protein
MLEELDLSGAFQPIAFVAGPNPPEVVDLSPYEPSFTFREEEPARPWESYSWDHHGHPHTTALYSHWQVLYLDDVLDRASESVPLSLLTGPAQDLDAWLEKLRELTSALHEAWATLHEHWQPLLKLIVRLQNRYLPEVARSMKLLWDAEAGCQVDPWPEERRRFDAEGTVPELGIEVAQIEEAYFFLVERGIRREPRDGMELLRRARPRSAHREWRGQARHVEDHFEAAQMIRLFLADLTGAPPGRPSAWPMDGRQPFRAYVFARGPVPDVTRDEIREALYDVDLDPHPVHVVGEGKSEKEFIVTIAEALAGAEKAANIGFSDLKGSGSAPHLATIIRGLATYVDRTVIIVDNEGQMKARAEELQRTGEMLPEDVLCLDRNLEEDNFTPEELVSVVTQLAADPPGDRPSVTLTITVEELEAAYAERGRRAGNDQPGRAGVLLSLAEHADPPARITKPEFAQTLAQHLVDELEATDLDTDEEREVLERRPILRFAIERVLPALSDGLP